MPSAKITTAAMIAIIGPLLFFGAAGAGCCACIEGGPCGVGGSGGGILDIRAFSLANDTSGVRTPVKLLARIVATWFGCGYAPIAPGTVGSLAAIAIAWLIERQFHCAAICFGALGVLLLAPAMWAADVFARQLGKKDPGQVVV